MKRKFALLLSLLFLLSACGEVEPSGASEAVPEASQASEAAEAPASQEEADWEITKIALNGDSITVEGNGAVVSGSVVTIRQAGKYQLSGTLTDGQILVDAGKEDEVCLSLNGVDITCSTSAPVYVTQAKQVSIDLEQGTENIVTDTANYVFAAGEDEPDAAIFAKDDLAIAGAGNLTVNGNYSMAIHGKDDVTMAGSGVCSLTAVGDGLKGKDSVRIIGGDITIDAGEDGIQSNNDKEEGKGVVTVEGGTIHITAGKDGIKAESQLALTDGELTLNTQEDGLHATLAAQVSGGTLTIDAQQDGLQADQSLVITGGVLDVTTGGGAENAPEHTEGFGFPGWFDAGSAESDTASAKGLKSDGDITVSGGTITLNCMDDALHCAGKLTVSDSAELTVSTGDDGFHSDDTLEISGGKINILKSYEGLEAVFINISGGDTALVASDDGLNAAGGSSADTDFAFMGPPGGEGKAETPEDATYYANITGGKLSVDAGGDGLDSNGALFVSGGEVYVSGPTNSMNGGLDYTTTGQITGGTVVVTGASGMAQNFDSSSTQCSLMYTLEETIPEGSLVTLTDASGKVLAEVTMQKSFNNVVISTPDMAVGQTYTLTCGDVTVEAEQTDTITSFGSFGFGGPGGGPGGRGGMPRP